MARAVRLRDDEDWHLETLRLHRIRRAAEADPRMGEEWKALVAATTDALSLLVTASTAGEASATREARARLVLAVGDSRASRGRSRDAGCADE